jgi:hypothetical protein
MVRGRWPVVKAKSSDRKPVAVGDQVLVQSGLDVVPGTVVDRYGEPPQVKLVVRLATGSEPDSDSPTIVVREADVHTVEEASELEPPGTWVDSATFEREVTKAIRRIARDDLATHSVLVEEEVSREGPDLRIIDLTGETPNLITDVEVKFTRRPELAAALADKLAALFERLPDDHARLVVSNAAITGPAARLLASRHIDYVTWRSPDDDPALAASLQRVLSHEHPKSA